MNDDFKRTIRNTVKASEEALAIKWYTYKPPAMVFIDDRAWRFEGTWPDLQELKKFKTWEEA